MLNNPEYRLKVLMDASEDVCQKLAMDRKDIVKKYGTFDEYQMSLYKTLDKALELCYKAYNQDFTGCTGECNEQT